jgi:hypothetical protein
LELLVLEDNFIFLVVELVVSNLVALLDLVVLVEVDHLTQLMVLLIWPLKILVAVVGLQIMMGLPQLLLAATVVPASSLSHILHK